MQGMPLNDGTPRSTHHLVPVMRRTLYSVCIADLHSPQTSSVVSLCYYYYCRYYYYYYYYMASDTR